MLSNTSQYALRALAFIAAQGGDEAVPGRRISEETAIPANYLAKILNELNNAGIVEASRGTGGGYRLAAPARSIMLHRIVAVFERELVHPSCVLGYSGPCADDNPCSAHSAWSEARTKFAAFLHLTSLAEIANSHELNMTRTGNPCGAARRGGR
ncbi:MAG: Rrf2 family transcriptional regulator [Bryobacterales bacterium]|nr:Rrf2 family transcriptional regulator [Bryobacterales bacterium]